MTPFGLLRRPSIWTSLAVHGGVAAIAWGSVSTIRPEAPSHLDMGAGFEMPFPAAAEPSEDEAVCAVEAPTFPEPIPVEPAAEPEDMPVETAPTGLDGPSIGLLGPEAVGLRVPSRHIGIGSGGPTASSVRQGPAAGGGGYVPSSPWPGNARPLYPALALARGVEGDVALLVRVGATGLVEGVTVEASSGHADLDDAAARAVATWRFEPASSSGTAVAETIRVPLRFRLR